jgi:hypothetical protein
LYFSSKNEIENGEIMKLLKKIIVLLIFVMLVTGFVMTVHEPSDSYEDSKLENVDSKNLFKHVDDYMIMSSNAMCTYESLSTGMFTDENKEDYYVVFKVDSDDELLKQWDQGTLMIDYQSYLQGTLEWIVNNKYGITMYYYNDNQEEIVFYQYETPGADHTISDRVSIPLDAKNKDIYIKYQSLLGKILFAKNGNDLRFKRNYLTITVE